MKLWQDKGGHGSPTLVLLHGLGANADVWRPLKGLLGEWPGRWIAPDLRGHGRSAHQAPYGYAVHAADVAELLGQDEEAIVVGHSMGGVVGMALASGWFGVRLRQVIAFGVKIRWAGGEAEKLQALARAPQRSFDRKEEAIERYLKVSGLFGLLDPASELAASGVREEGGKFRLAADPMINAVVGPDIKSLVAAMTCPLRLAAGSKDPMTSFEDMRAFDPRAHVFEGAGHNVHVERPEEFWRFVHAVLKG